MLRIAIHSCAKGVYAQLMASRGQVLDELTKIAVQSLPELANGLYSFRDRPVESVLAQ